MNNFWEKLPRPFFILAPMDDVTDTVFRQVVAKVASPDIFFSEFISTDGLCSRGKEKLIPKLQFTEKERPIVAQIWGTNPDYFFEAAKLIKVAGFNGIDINMGCPDKKVLKKGSGAAHINNPALVKEIVEAVKKGAGGLPVSIKTRIGLNTIQTEEWVNFLLTLGLAALTIHGRIAKDMSRVPADWEQIALAVGIKNKLKVKTLIVGNGDVVDRQDGLQKVKDYGVDGVMIGRGILKNIQAFTKINRRFSEEEMLQVMLLHAQLFEKTWGTQHKRFASLKKFFKAYTNGLNDASRLRESLMATTSTEQIRKIVKRRLTG
ncbi:MAG: tRNA-dihydrouridine synthase [Armatimonadetes bacterium]|nr:MAG: tRNA-dihydrouridine synthase [Armatimonadota bacterium]